MNTVLSVIINFMQAGTATVVQDRFLNDPVAYTIGAILSVILLAYLVYALFKPEKF
jgi:K+-transporting ATPase KdpF subunit